MLAGLQVVKPHFVDENGLLAVPFGFVSHSLSRAFKMFVQFSVYTIV
jgi:hypothetical protein